jgi:DNA-binding CsgD family transcriptional regulator
MYGLENRGITPREMEVVSLAAQGLTDNQIARHLRIAPSTIRNHMASVCRKIGALTRFMCGVLAERSGLFRHSR